MPDLDLATMMTIKLPKATVHNQAACTTDFIVDGAFKIQIGIVK